MNKGIQIGKVFGIKIRIDWSWLLIFMLVFWSISSMFAQLHPQWSLLFTIFMGVIGALLFFISVLFHEMAHSITAKAQGLPVESITLFLFGGLANIREEPKSPGNEFLMAILGPVTSLLIGFGLLFLSGIGVDLDFQQIADPYALLHNLSAIRTLGLWLGSVNIILGIFNLIPGFPLDGGRVLRSIIWAATDNIIIATRWAAFVGQAFAWIMIFSGLAMIFGLRIPIFGEGVINGVWLAFIGWFLNNAASQSYQQLVVRDILEGVPVLQITKQNPPTVPADISIEELIENFIMKLEEHSYPVIENDQLVGIVCLHDVRKVDRIERSTTFVSDIMTKRSELRTISPEAGAYEALMKISRNGIRQLIVMKGDEMLGIVRRSDIVRFLQLQSDTFLKKEQL